jgi:VRR-NUC domain
MKVLRPMASQASEHQLQATLCEYLDLQKPKPLYFAVGNGGRRSIGVAVKLKREGVKRGVSDLVFVLHERCAFLEMKIKGGKLSADQKAFRDEVQARGHFWGMAKTHDEAIEFLTSVGALKAGRTLK